MPIADVSTQALADLISLKGRTAVVTGGAKGLGCAIASRLAEAGAAVLIGDLDADGARRVARELTRKDGPDAVATRLDVTDGASVAAAAELAMTQWGRLDIWVNNAGIYPLTPVLQMTDEDWDRVMNVNLRGTFIGCREAARRMKSGGVVVNLASTAGFKGMGPGITHYVASKHGVRGITRQMALEFAGQGIRVLAVAPTLIVTEGVESAMSGPAKQAGLDLNQVYNSMLGRPGRPDDVARVVLFCVSDLALFMTGSTLLVDAGEMLR